MKHDSNDFCNSLGHVEQHHEAVPWLMPVGLRPAQCRQAQGISGTAHPRQSRAPLPRLQPLFWVLCWVQPRFLCAVFLRCSDSCWCTSATDTWSSGSLTSAPDLAKHTSGVFLLTTKIVSFLIKITCIGALAKSILVFVFFIGTEGDPGYYKLIRPISVPGKPINLEKTKKRNTAIRQLENHDKMRSK